MTLQNRTKHLFARKLREMMEEMPFGQIKVTDLCERAGTSKQVFYYHFHDKYELAAWMLNNEWPLEIESGETFENLATKQYAYYWEHRDFHRNLFLDPGQYNMMQYQIEHTMDILRNTLYTGRQEKTLTLEEELWVRYHSYGMVNLLRDWILGNVKMTPEEFAHFQYSRYSDDFKQAITKYWGTVAD